MNHADLVKIAAAWLLSHRCTVVVTEVATMGEIPDALGFICDRSYLIECKTSRSDFATDKDKLWRRMPNMGLGQLRYFMTPTGLLKPEELPEKWGLIVVNDEGKTRKIKDAQAQEHNKRAEITILVSTIRRLGIAENGGCSIKKYEIPTGASAGLGFFPEGGEG